MKVPWHQAVSGQEGYSTPKRRGKVCQHNLTATETADESKQYKNRHWVLMDCQEKIVTVRLTGSRLHPGQRSPAGAKEGSDIKIISPLP